MLGALPRRLLRGFSILTSSYSKTTVPAAFLLIEDAAGRTARLRLRLNEHLNPEAAGHFLALCTAQHNGYRNARFVNNLPGFYIETEERPLDNYLDESYPAAFAAPGMVGLSRPAGDRSGRSSGGFFLTLQRLPDLGRFVWVAQVLSGLDALRALDLSSPPRIADCGPDGHAAAEGGPTAI